MKVFVTLGPDQRQVAAEAAAAEAAGFDGVSTGEHLFFHGATPNAFVSLATAAGATSRVRLLSSLTVLPLYPAALAAKLATSLDQVSCGRFDFGVGVGGEFPDEFVAAGVPTHERGARADEALEVIEALFTGQTTEFRGSYTHIPGLQLMPSPIRSGGPPLWVGGRRPSAMRRAGRFADVWFPYMYTPEQLAKSLNTVRENAERHGRDPATVTGAIHCWGGVDDSPAHSRAEVTDAVSEIYQQDFGPLADRYLLHGRPDQVLARMTEYRDAGADALVFCPIGSGMRRTAIVDSFAQEVLGKAQSPH